jgi:hypothetical protein
MKKLGILVLLVALAGSAAFAIEGIGDFTAALELSVENATSGKTSPTADDKPVIVVDPSITFSRAFGPVGLSATLGDVLKFSTNSDLDGKIYDELYLKIVPSYSVKAGPGTFTAALVIKPVFVLAQTYAKGQTKPDSAVEFVIDPVLSYVLPQSFGTLNFELGTDSIKISKGASQDPAKKDDYGLGIADAYLKAGIALPMGLSVWVSPRLFIACSDFQDDTNLTEVRADVSYKISDMISAGLEGRIRIGTEKNANQMKHNGILVKPHAEVSLGAIGAWVACEIDRIGADAGDVTVKPIIGGSYSF